MALRDLASNDSPRLEMFEGIGYMRNLEDEDGFNRALHLFLESVEW